MIDLHSHILPGLDDGARSFDDSREIAAAAVAEGVTAIAATPHVRGDYPTRPTAGSAEPLRRRRTGSSSSAWRTCSRATRTVPTFETSVSPLPSRRSATRPLPGS